MTKNRLTRIVLVRIPPAPAIASQPPICRLANLTPELHFEIFSYSEHVSSTYLGHTCKALAVGIRRTDEYIVQREYEKNSHSQHDALVCLTPQTLASLDDTLPPPTQNQPIPDIHSYSVLGKYLERFLPPLLLFYLISPSPKIYI
jgi:hypothetical protein